MARQSSLPITFMMADGTIIPTVSILVTVYNKARQLPATIRSILAQIDDEEQVECIFVDDASSDGSIDVIRRETAGCSFVRVITNQDNLGPSIRLNQAAKAARGTFLYPLDADDIALHGAMRAMHELLVKENAGFIYGKRIKRVLRPCEACHDIVDREAPYHVSERPLAHILRGGFVRMMLMCRRELFLAAGGADPRIFVQDESLPLRLAARAERFIDWQAAVILVPLEAGRGAKEARPDQLSHRKTQLHHDAFLAYHHALCDLGDDHADLRPALYAKAVSAYWKYARRELGRAARWRALAYYIEAKLSPPSPRWSVLERMKSDFLSCKGIRRAASLHHRTPA